MTLTLPPKLDKENWISGDLNSLWFHHGIVIGIMGTHPIAGVVDADKWRLVTRRRWLSAGLTASVSLEHLLTYRFAVRAAVGLFHTKEYTEKVLCDVFKT